MTTFSSTYRPSTNTNHSVTPSAASPFNWLRDGWSDFVNAPALSIMLGSVFTALCVAAYSAAAALPVVSGTVLSVLLLASPFVAAAAYFVAQNREQGDDISLAVILRGVRNRAMAIGLFALLCALIVGAWVRLSSIAFALYFGTLGVSASQRANSWMGGFDYPAMLVFMTLTGAVLGLVLFATGAITLPMIADRNCNVITAVQSSLVTLRNNWTTMLFWMLIVIAYVAVAIVSGLVLMPIVFPLLAYATWHSYRELTESSER